MLSAQQENIAIMRVENGWLIRADGGSGAIGCITPLKVAETPEALCRIVSEWAASQDAAARVLRDRPSRRTDAPAGS